MAILTASGVSFEFSNGHQLFQGVSFSLGEGLTALVGPNGVGKTTLARLITGRLEPSEGFVSHDERFLENCRIEEALELG